VIVGRVDFDGRCVQGDGAGVITTFEGFVTLNKIGQFSPMKTNRLVKMRAFILSSSALDAVSMILREERCAV
jgi:hypothetical protein